MDINRALEAARATHQSVLTTLRRDGRPQLSNVLHGLGEDGVIRISTTADRAKYANLRRTPWAALHVNGDSFWSYAVIEADVELSEVAADPHDATVDELVALYRQLSGEARRLGRVPRGDGARPPGRRPAAADAGVRRAALT